MKFTHTRTLIFSILSCIATTGLGTLKCYNAQQRAQEIAENFTWPEGKKPGIVVRTTKDISPASCIISRDKTLLIIELHEPDFNRYTHKAKDFILAHEIAHYYLLHTGYLPAYSAYYIEYLGINKLLNIAAVTCVGANYYTSLKLLLSRDKITGNRFKSLYYLSGAAACYLPYKQLQRLVEYEADKQAVLALRDKTGAFEFFNIYIKTTQKNSMCTFMKSFSFYCALFSTHPLAIQRKKSIDQISIY